MTIDTKTKLFLQNIGLNSNEMKIYVSSLSKPGATVSAIAQKAGVHRVAAYQLIDSLIEKGLLSYENVAGKKHVQPVHPKNISKVFNKKRRELRKLELRFEEILPNLTALSSAAIMNQQVLVFHGDEAIRDVQEDIINSTNPEETVYSVVNLELLYKIFPQYNAENEYRFRRMQKGFRNKVIVLDTPVGKKLLAEDPKGTMTETRLVDAQRFPISMNMTIYGNKVSITSLKEPIIAIIIESQYIADNLRIIHQLAWEGAKSL